MPPLMTDEDRNFGGSLVLDFGKWWRHVKTIYSQSIRVALSSLVDKQTSAFSFVTLTGNVLKLQIYSVQPQQHETELSINNNLYYRMN